MASAAVRPPTGAAHLRSRLVADVLFLALTAVCFTLLVALVRAAEKL